ncbi:MAG: DUF1043 domain-containing protein [Gammaproteobacteria bacterium HGW-Gammaproteobacteria-14]|nr:MAG: DUF1043 domain-containing protein [Gammaproteobacteria bacterium HGW-Gammaproteobacteria-14]
MGSFTATLIVLTAGLIAGAGLAWLFLPYRRNWARLEKERDDARLALARYREEVDSHFLRTADLVNQMNHAYRAVHEQLAEGARQLCSEQGRRLAMAKTFDLLGDNDEQIGEEVSPPLDYAPSHKGTLSENYGFRRDEESDVHETTVADDLLNPPRDYADGCDAQGCPTEPTEQDDEAPSKRT